MRRTLSGSLVIVCGVGACHPTFAVIGVHLVLSQRCNHHLETSTEDCIRSDELRRSFNCLVDHSGVWSTVGVVALKEGRVRTRIKSYNERSFR